MGARVRRVGGEAAKFSAVNGVATFVAVVLFNALAHGVQGIYHPGPLNGWPVTAWFIANCIGMAISFYGSRRYAFKHRRPAGPGGGALNYTLVNLASFVIPMACLWLTRNVMGWNSAVADNISANVVGAGFGMLFRFWAFRRFVFKKRKGSLFPTLQSEQAPAQQPEHVAGAHSPDLRRESGSAPELGPDEPELLEHEPQ